MALTTPSSFFSTVTFLLLATLTSAAHPCDPLGLWPQPLQCELADSPSLLVSGPVAIQISPSTRANLHPEALAVLDAAIKRYSSIISKHKPGRSVPPSNNPLQLRSVNITVRSNGSSPSRIVLDSNEQYQLQFDGSSIAVVESQEVWGALRALETLSQLLAAPNGSLPVSNFSISDQPRFAYRGMMMDTGRHFLSLPTIFAFMDAMAYNKLNVLHWHITDDESFPLQTKSYPSLSEKGAFEPEGGLHVYSSDDVDAILEFARLRGIRVIPELDMPGHTTSWFKAFPSLRTTCPTSTHQSFPPPMNPANNATYEFISTLLKEVSGRFPDALFHIGGDEVQGSCWEANEEVQSFCKQRGLASMAELQLFFESAVVDVLTKLGKTAVIWEENFGSSIGYPKGAVVEVWKETYGNATMLDEVVKAGHKAIYTTHSWYFDWQWNGVNQFSKKIDDASQWQFYYEVDPFTNSTLTSEEREMVLGGEAAMWDIYFDDTNFLSNAFPRGLSVGERLWSDASVRDIGSAETRILEQRCRLLSRGIPVAPVAWSDSCPIPFQFHYMAPY